MSWDGIQATAAVQPSTSASAIERHELLGPTQEAAPTFGTMVTEGLNQLNGQLLATQADLQQLAVGNVQNLHQIMIRLEESRLSFQLMMQVRNRVLEAYQDLMKMQV